MQRREVYCLLVLLTVGFAVRVLNLGQTPLWVDEAESSINSLTILDQGLPVDHYLGIPIYENTLVWPWSGNPEYEFRDISYSEKGLAIYHGWLPLYSIAASFRLFGIVPDRPTTGPLRVRHDTAERRRRTLAARAPAVLFGMLTLIAVFVAASTLYGKDAGWAALLVAALFTVTVGYSQQARYYAATVLWSVLCGLLLWLMVGRGQWRYYVLSGLCLVLLFHTHILSCVLFCLLTVGTTPWLLRQKAGILKLGLLGAILAAGALPWLLATGFLRQTAKIPRAATLLDFPRDLFTYPWEKLHYTVLAVTGCLLLAGAQFYRDHLPERVTAPLDAAKRPYVFLVAWGTLAYLLFVFTIPAASFFHSRITLLLTAPGLLLIGCLFASVCRILTPGHSAESALAISILFLVSVKGIWQPSLSEDPWRFLRVIELLEGREWVANTRFYATPNDHLTLTFYTGLPVQSIAPVRKAFLDYYPGPVVLLEPIYHGMGQDDPIFWKSLQEAARSVGCSLSDQEALNLSDSLATRDFRLALRSRVASVTPAVSDIPDFARVPLMNHEAQQRRFWADGSFSARVWPMSAGFHMGNGSDWWPIFFYRFVGPDARRGAHLNYRDRMRNARAEVVGKSWAVLTSSTPSVHLQ